MTTETETQLTQLAGVRVPCPGKTLGSCRKLKTCICGGIGLVYLFPETVRVATKTYHHFQEAECDKKSEGGNCFGHVVGWTASLDGWVWQDAMPENSSVEFTYISKSGYLRVKKGINVRCIMQWVIGGELQELIGDGESAKVAFFTALWQAVDKYPGRIWP